MVVQAPPNVVSIGLAPVAPPCVALIGGVWLECAVNVTYAASGVVCQQHVHPRALFRCESAVFLVAAPVFQVFFAMGNVDITAQHKLSLGFETH